MEEIGKVGAVDTTQSLSLILPSGPSREDSPWLGVFAFMANNTEIILK